jgi:hypothetical protein
VCVLQAQSVAVEKLPDISKTQDVNGFMPDRVWIRTMTQTYCKGFSFVVVDGRIYVKRDKDKSWTLFLKKGLPFSKDSPKVHSYFKTPAAVREICADDDSLFAIDDQGVQYNCYINFGTEQKLFEWRKIFGWPKRTPLVQNELVQGKRGWSMGVRRENILWYTDRFGNEHHYGTMGLETVYYLTKDGRHIRFTDSGLPTDFSHSIQCPLDGTFISENISVSGSTIFLIGSDGTMYTRLIDFDTMGCDPMFFKYTYDYEKQNLKGSDYRSNFTTWALPAEDWKMQPKISLEAGARLSKMISIAQTGQGNSARELRVAGTDTAGKPGYYHKRIDEKVWSFTPKPLVLPEEDFLDGTKPVVGSNDNFAYEGYLTKNGTTLDGYTCYVKDVPLTSEGECTLTITHGKEQVTVKLYTVEMWTFMTRFNPGFDGTAKNYFVTPEFEADSFKNLSQDFQSLVTDMFGGKYHKLFALSAETTVNYFQMQCTGKDMRTVKDPLAKANEYLFFMTKDGIPDIHPDAYKGLLMMEQPLLKEADSPDLLLKSGRYTIRDRSLIEEKIRKNSEYKKLLEGELSTYKEYEKQADSLRWGYNAVDLITTITLLNKVDFPKIKTMTTYGGELMNTNAESFANLAGYKEWCYSHILELVDLRISCFNEIISQFDDNKISAQLPARLCNTFPEYFALVNLPEHVEGTSVQDKKAHLEEITFIPYFPGYLLQLEDDSDTTILIELHDSASTIFDRAGDETLVEKPFVVPVSFATVTVLSQTKSEKEKNSTAGIKELSMKDGNLIWNGETLIVTVNTTPFTKQSLFIGK